MDVAASIRAHIKVSRKRGAAWVRALDTLRLVATAEGRGSLWTRVAHRGDVHQTTPYTCEDRYPELFDRAAELAPEARRILSFGCSTGEELSALRRRFPAAEIVGAEINPRSRRIARRRMSADALAQVVSSNDIDGTFDLIFALAVLQREPHRVKEIDVRDLTPFYPFAQFDQAVASLARWLRPGGFLFVANAQYRVEDSSAAGQLDAVEASSGKPRTLFGRDGRRLDGAVAAAIFCKFPRPR